MALLGAQRVIAVDVTPGLIEMTRRQAEADRVADKVSAVCGDLTEIQPEPVDVIISYAVLHHVPDRIEEVIQTMLRWLKPGGAFIYCEPVCYVPGIDWIRYRSGVSYDALDPGERKLTGRDLRSIEKYFRSGKRVHFRVLGRLSRILPSADAHFRKADVMLRYLPGSRYLAGTALGVCQA